MFLESSCWVCNQNSDRRCKCKNCFSDKRHLIVLLLYTLTGLSLTYYRRLTTDYSKLSHTELFFFNIWINLHLIISICRIVILLCFAHMVCIYLTLIGASHNPWTSSSFLELSMNLFLLSASFVRTEISSHTWWKWSHKWPKSPIIKSAICIVLGAKKNQCAEGISPSEDLMMSFWTTALHTA